MAMTDVHRTTLRKARVFLLDNLDIDNIIHPLVVEDIVKSADEDALSAHTIKRDKIKYLIDLLPRKGDVGYTALLKVLKELQTFVYERLCEIEREILQSQQPARTPQQLGFTPPSARKQESDPLRGIVAQPSSLSPESEKPSRQSDPLRGIVAQPSSLSPESEKPSRQFVNFVAQDTLEPMSKDEADTPGSNSPRSPSSIVSDKALGTLASNLGAEWEQLAIHMGFQQNKLYHWKCENVHSVWGQVFSMLTAWKQLRANGATISELLAVLQSLEPPLDPSAYKHLYYE